MKRLLAIALAALLLTGCTPDVPAPTEPSMPETTPATEEIVITHESLELLEFDYENVFSAAPMGEDLLLFSNMDSTTLIKVSGRNHKELASFAANVPISPDFRAVQISENSICYAAEEEYIFLNENLEEVERVTLPGASCTGIVAQDQNTIYYSTGSELRIYNRETGLDRLLRETMFTELFPESLALNDSVLICRQGDQTLFYSASTGELLASFEDSINLTSAGDTWLAKTSDGRRNQIVFGGGGETRVVTGFDSFSDVTLVDGGILMHPTGAIRFLNLTDSTEAAIAPEGDVCVTNAWISDGILWIALDDGRLLRWELEDAETQAVSCFAPYYNQENPDTEGLAALESVIADLESTYGVTIHIYEDAVAVQPEDMTLRCEYQVDAIASGLQELELALKRLPADFLRKAAKSTAGGGVHISLVRSVEGGGCIQFWDEEANARIILETDEDLQEDFFHALAHIIDAKILTKTTIFDGWKNLNPKGFKYSYDYAAEMDPDAFPGAFADETGMVSPVEDRATIFAAAMADDGSFFENETAQRKLSALCSGIRRAFGLKDSEEILPWEQHLAA